MITVFNKERGFTIVETIVSLAIFTTVMIIASGALLSLINANRKSQATQSVMNNVNFAVESMTRAIRVGTGYSGGGASFTFTNSDGDLVTYTGQTNEETGNGEIVVSVDSGPDFSITAGEVDITALSFLVSGEGAGDGEQSRVRVIIRGVVEPTEKSKTEFNIQTTLVQRIPGS